MKTKILNKDGNFSLNSLNAIRESYINKETNRIYPVKYVGKGNFINKKDYSDYIREILRNENIDFTEGNDAPRGGKNGNFIQTSKEGIDYLLKIIEK